MMKKIKNIWLIGVVLLLVVGCVTQPQPTVQAPTQILPTSTPNVIYITATPEAQVVTATPASMVVAPSATPAAPNASITLTQINDQGGGKAIIEWKMDGNFPSGFVIVWSLTNQNPTYPADQYVVAGDPGSRSALVTVNMNKIYYLRVCRLVGASCDVYSNLGIFALSKVGSTPVAGGGTGGGYTGPTALPTAYNSGGGVITSSTSITINSVKSIGSGKAQITWTGVGTFSSGFRILYSTSSKTPYVGGYPYYSISSGSTRIAYIDGAAGKKYYYRICRTTGTTCDIYSNTYTYTFPGTEATATPDGSTIGTPTVTDTTYGKASVDWTATGGFSNGFMIVYASGTSTPTLSNNHVLVSDGTLRSGVITGTPGTLYYIRVCKYNGTSCDYYSPTVTFTFYNGPATITLTDITPSDTGMDVAQVNWTALGSFPNGFKLMYSQTNATPTLSDSVIDITDSTIRSATFSGTMGVTYHVRLCKYLSGACDVYSNVVDYTFPGG